MDDASIKMEPYFRAYKTKYFRVIINLGKLMGNEKLKSETSAKDAGKAKNYNRGWKTNCN